MKLRNRWMLAVPVLLAAHLSLMSWAVVRATADKNGAVIPDYYNKSLRWDADRVAAGQVQQTQEAPPPAATRPAH